MELLITFINIKINSFLLTMSSEIEISKAKIEEDLNIIKYSELFSNK
jgi:hypothetical protein